MSAQEPYLTKVSKTEDRAYNPDFGDNRLCGCGHSYYRHFDSYEDMGPIGCKYCACYDFKEGQGELALALRKSEGDVEKHLEVAFRAFESLGEPFIDGTFHQRTPGGQDVESVVISKQWVESYLKLRTRLLVGEEG